MDGIQLRDEAVRDRIRAAEEFLDPRKEMQSTYSVPSLMCCRGPASTQLPSRDPVNAQSWPETIDSEHR